MRTGRFQRILELGSGDYSTSVFLSYPCVEVLTSVEPIAEWRERIDRGDRRHEILEQLPSARSLLSYSLVMIDNGGTSTVKQEREDERRSTIRTVLSQPHPLVVVHDASTYSELLPGGTALRGEHDTAVVPPG
jgi:hypothetical protein